MIFKRLTTIVLLLNISLSFAQSNRVWYVSPSGNNNNDGKYSDPLLTVQAALDSSNVGDTIALDSGSYEENITFPNHKITLTSFYVFDGNKKHVRNTVIDGSNYYGNNPLINTSNSEFHIIGLKISGAPKQVLNSSNNNNSSIENCHIYQCGNNSIWGVVALGGNTLIDRCVFEENYGRYIVSNWIRTSGVRNKITRTIFKKNGLSSQTGGGYASVFSEGRMEINTCLFYDNISACIATGGNGVQDSIIIENNTIVNNKGYGISFENWGGGSLNVLYNNIIYGNKHNLVFNNYSGYSIILMRRNHIRPYLGNTNMVPSKLYYKLTDFGQDTLSKPSLDKSFRLSNSSPLLGYGFDSPFKLNTDIEGNSRPMPSGSNPDLGAYENAAAFPSPVLLTSEGGDKKITVTWSQSSFTGLSKYKLYRSTSPISDTATVGLVTDTLSAKTLSYKDSGLTNLTRYYYRIKSVNSSGAESGFSNELSARPNTPPSAVDSVLVQNGPRLNYISWSASKSSSVKYQIYRGTTKNNLQVIKDTTSKLNYLDTGLAAWKSYYYSIRAIDTVGVPSAYGKIKVGVPNNIWWVDTKGNDKNLGFNLSPLLKIQTAVNRANSNDSVFLEVGTYFENVKFNGKNVLISSKYKILNDTSLIRKTIVNGNNKGHVFELSNNETRKSTIQGLHITNGWSGIYLANAAPQLFDLRFTDNKAYHGRGSAIVGYNCAFLAEGCLFENHVGTAGVITISGNFRGFVLRNLIIRNNKAQTLSMISTDQANGLIENILIYNNGDVQGVGIINAYYGVSIVNSTIITGNAAPVRLLYNNVHQSKINVLNSILWSTYNGKQIELNNNNPITYLGVANSVIKGGGSNIELLNTTTLDTGSSYSIWSSEPEFLNVKNADFKLANNSVYIGKGINFRIFNGDTVWASRLSLNGLRPIPTGSNPDLGAYENSGAFPSPVLLTSEGSDKKITVTWSQSSFTGLNKYKLYRSTKPISDTATVGLVADTLSAKTLLYRDSGLTNLTRYYYRIKSVNSSGVESGFSNELSARPNTPPSAVDSVLVQNGPRLNYISWSVSKSSPVKYRVYRGLTKNNLKVIRDTTSKLNYLDTGLTAWKTYYYAIRAIDTVGVPSAYSSIKLGVPNNIWWVDTAGSDKNMGSSWSALLTIESAVGKAGSLTRDTILVKAGLYKCNIDMFKKKVLIVSESGAKNTILEPKSKYSPVIKFENGETIESEISGFMVRDAHDARGVSVNSSKGIVRNMIFTNCGKNLDGIVSNHWGGVSYENCLFVDNPGPVVNACYKDTNNNNGIVFNHCVFYNNRDFGRECSGAGPGKTQFYNCILWNNNKSVLNGDYWMQYCTTDDSLYAKKATNMRTEPIFRNPKNFDYALLNSSELIGKGSNNITKWGTRKLTNAVTDFTYKARPNPAGSNPDLGAYENSAAFPSPVLLSSDGGNKKITVTWSQSSFTGLNKYKLYRSTKPISDTATVGLVTDTLGAKTLSYKDSGLTNLTRYYYRIKSVNSSGVESGFSNELSARPNTPPSAVDSVLVQNGPRLNYISWSASKSSSVKYQIYRGTTKNNLQVIKDTTSKLNYLDTGLAAWKSYYYSIRAIDTVGVPSAYGKIKVGVPNNIWWVDTAGSSVSLGTFWNMVKSPNDVMNLVMDGDTILLNKGVFYGAINITKGITLSSSWIMNKTDVSRIDNTVLDGSKTTLPIITVGANINAQYKIIGFKFVNCSYGAIKTNGNNYKALIYKNTFRDNFSNGKWLVDLYGNETVDSCVFENNEANGLVFMAPNSKGYGLPTIARCLFVKNGSDYSHGSNYYNGCIYIGRSCGIVRNCVLIENKYITPIYIGVNNYSNMDTAYITSNSIINNKQNGIHITNNINGSYSTVNFRNNIIDGNRNNITFMPNSSQYCFVNFYNNFINKPYSKGFLTYNDISGFNSAFKVSWFNNDTINQNHGIDLTKTSSVFNPSHYGRYLGFGSLGKYLSAFDFYGNPAPFPSNSNPDVGAIESKYSFPSPQLDRIQPDHKKITVTWSQSSFSGLSKYKLYRSTSPISDTATIGLVTDTLSAKTLSYKDSGLTNLTRYYYRIKSVNSSRLESGFSNELSARPNTPPSSVDSVLVQNGPRINYITWSASKSSPVKYRIYRGTTKNNLQIIIDETSKFDFLDTGLMAWKTYYYAICAIDTVGVQSMFSKVKFGVPNNIWWVSTTGDNKNIGTSTYPLRTIKEGVKRSDETYGDTVYINKGKYVENIDYLGKDILISSLYKHDKDTSLIRSTVIDGDNKGNVIDVKLGETYKARLEGLSITNGYAGIVIDNQSKLSIRDINLYANGSFYAIGSAIIVTGSCAINAENILIQNHKGNGGLIYITSWGSYGKFNNLIVRNNSNITNAAYVNDLGSSDISNALFYNNGDVPCIGMMNTTDGFNIINSTLISGKAAPIRVLYNNVQSTQIGIANTILQSSHSGKQIEINNHNPSTSISLRSVVVPGGISNIEKLINTTIDTGTKNTILDAAPLFKNVNKGDYRLRNNSLMIGQGEEGRVILGNDSLVIPNTDIEGNPRPSPSGSNPDLGAYESPFETPGPYIDSVRTLGDTMYTYINLSSRNKAKYFYIRYRDTAEKITFDSTKLYSSTNYYIVKNSSLKNGRLYKIQADLNKSTIGPSNVKTAVLMVKPDMYSPSYQATMVDTNESLKWWPSPYAQKYRVQLSNFSSFGTTMLDEIVTVDSLKPKGLKLNRTYYWRTLSMDTLGRSLWSDIFSYQTEIQKASIDSLRFTPRKVKLHYSLQDTINISKFYVYRDNSANASDLIDSMNATERVFVDSFVKPGLRYYYRLKVVNKQGVVSNFGPERALNILERPSPLNPQSEQDSVAWTSSFTWSKSTQAQKSEFELYQWEQSSSLINKNISNMDTTTVASLKQNRYHIWRVRALDSCGRSEWSDTFRMQTKVAPTKITQVKSNVAHIDLTWQSVDTFNVKDYVIYRDTSANMLTILDSVIYIGNAYRDSLLAAGVRYYYQIRVRNRQGSMSDPSPMRSASVLEAPILVKPVNMKTNESRNPVHDWQKVKYATKYRVQVSSDSQMVNLLANTLQTPNSFALSNLKYSTYYFWKVRAEDSTGYGAWSELRLYQTEVQIPVLKMVSSKGNLVEINWELKDTTNAASFLIFRDTVVNPQRVIDSISSSERSYFDTNIATNTRYFYSIVLKNRQHVKGQNSNVKAINVMREPTLIVPGDNNPNITTSLIFDWSSEKFANSYRIHVSTDSLFTNRVEDTSISFSSVTMGVFKRNTNYFWRVRCEDTLGYGVWSQTFKYQTELDIPELTFIATEDRRSTIKWVLNDTTNFDNLNGFYIYRDTLPDAKKLIDSVNSGLLSYVDTNVKVSTMYYYRLKTRNKQNVTSDFSNERRAAILNKPILITPNNSSYENKLISTFKWTKQRYANEYQLQVSYDSIVLKSFIDFTVSDVDSLKLILSRKNYFYFWKVRSIDSLGVSGWSSINKFQTELTRPLIDTTISGNKKIRIYWKTSDTQNIKNYRIYRDTSKSNPTFVKSVTNQINKNNFDYLDSGLVNFKTYFYWISAVNNQNIESQKSLFKINTTFNIAPVANNIKDTAFENIGRISRFKRYFNQDNAFDKDGWIDSTVWFIDDIRVSNRDTLKYLFRQGTTKVDAIVYDNDLASDTNTFYVNQLTYRKKLRAGIVAGISIYDKNEIYVADTSLNSFGLGEVLRVDSLGKTTFNYLVSQRIRTTPSFDFSGNMYLTNGINLTSFTKTGAPFLNEIALGGLSFVTPTIDSVLGMVYLGLSNRKFFAIDADHGGKIKWDFTTDAPISAPAVVTAGRKLIFPDVSGNLYGFDITYSYKPKTGDAPNWKWSSSSDSILLAPAIDTMENIIVGTTSGKLMKLSFDTLGKINTKWSVNLKSRITTSAVIDAYGHVYVACENGLLYCLKSSNGDTLWSFNTGAKIVSTPTLSENSRVYVANTVGDVFALDTSKKIMWYYRGKESIVSHLVHFDGVLYLPTLEGSLCGIYDVGILNDISTIKSQVTKRNKQMFIPKPIWGTYQGNYRRTGIQDFIFRVVPDKSADENSIIVFPNPTDNGFIIESLFGINRVDFFDNQGRLVYNTINNRSTRINYDQLTLLPGVYILKVNTEKGIVMKRLIITGN